MGVVASFGSCRYADRIAAAASFHWSSIAKATANSRSVPACSPRSRTSRRNASTATLGRPSAVAAAARSSNVGGDRVAADPAVAASSPRGAATTLPTCHDAPGKIVADCPT